MKNHDKHLKYETAQELGISYRNQNQKEENNKSKKQKKEKSKK